MSFDLVGLRAARSLLPDWLVKRLPVPQITIDELVSFLLGMGEAWVKGALDIFFDGALRLINVIDHLPGVDLENFYWRVDALGEGVRHRPHADAAAAAGRDADDAARRLPGRLRRVLRRRPRRPRSSRAIDAFGVEVRGGIRTALGGAATMFDDLGTTFAAEADRAASMGSVAPHARARRRLRPSCPSASSAPRPTGCGPTRRHGSRTRSRPRSSRPSTSGGFALVGGAIPAYVGEMRRFWATKRPPVPIADLAAHPGPPRPARRRPRAAHDRARERPRRPTGSSPRSSRRGCTTRSARRTSAAAASSSASAARRCAGRARPPGRRPVTSRPGAGSGS